MLHQRLFRTYMSLLQEGYKLYFRHMVAQQRINKEMSFTTVAIIFSISCILIVELYLCFPPACLNGLNRNDFTFCFLNLFSSVVKRRLLI
jgi:hypothetical protein